MESEIFLGEKTIKETDNGKRKEKEGYSDCKINKEYKINDVKDITKDFIAYLRYKVSVKDVEGKILRSFGKEGKQKLLCAGKILGIGKNEYDNRYVLMKIDILNYKDLDYILLYMNDANYERIIKYDTLYKIFDKIFYVVLNDKYINFYMSKQEENGQENGQERQELLINYD